MIQGPKYALKVQGGFYKTLRNQRQECRSFQTSSIVLQLVSLLSLMRKGHGKDNFGCWFFCFCYFMRVKALLKSSLNIVVDHHHEMLRSNPFLAYQARPWAEVKDGGYHILPSGPVINTMIQSSSGKERTYLASYSHITLYQGSLSEKSGQERKPNLGRITACQIAPTALPRLLSFFASSFF